MSHTLPATYLNGKIHWAMLRLFYCTHLVSFLCHTIFFFHQIRDGHEIKWCASKMLLTETVSRILVVCWQIFDGITLWTDNQWPCTKFSTTNDVNVVFFSTVTNKTIGHWNATNEKSTRTPPQNNINFVNSTHLLILSKHISLCLINSGYLFYWEAFEFEWICKICRLLFSQSCRLIECMKW